MDTLLIAVTGVSLALAGGMGVLLARLLREERRRSDARVQLLEELAAGASLPASSAPAVPRRSSGPAVAEEDVHLPSFLTGSHMLPADLPLRESAATVATPELFHEDSQPSPWPRRVAVIGGLAAVLTLAIAGWSQVRGTAPDPGQTSAAAPAASLELLSLRHSREGGTLTVTGLVQNPAGSAALSNVQATVFVFGPGGTFITSARAPLDFTSLTPGDESPFVVKVPVRGEVSRYRVGFRGPDDRVVGHVDRRTDQIGRNQ